MRIRFATVSDSKMIRKIYSQYIDTPITFEYVLPSEAEFTERVKEIITIYPYLVCEENGHIIGYAYAHRQKERMAYQWNAELSVYLDNAYVARGIGRKLYSILIELLKMQGIKTIYGGVTIPNKKSETLHLALGFNLIGIYHNTGYKCGKWHDVAWFEKEIAPYGQNPQPVIPIHKLSKEALAEIIQKDS